jgi:hypothetical protein
MQAGEIGGAAIHDIERTRFGNQEIERMGIVPLVVGNVDGARNVSTQIQQGCLLTAVLVERK